jgi:hypothetical protein
MSRTRFAVTYEIVTDECAQFGDVDERGYIEESATLGDAIHALRRTRTSRVDGIESIQTDGQNESVTIRNGMEFETGANESRTLHIPGAVTHATAARIVRLAYGQRVLGRGRHVRAVWYCGDMGAFADSFEHSSEGIQRYCRAPDAWGVYDRERGGTLAHIVDHATRQEAESDIAQ